MTSKSKARRRLFAALLILFVLLFAAIALEVGSSLILAGRFHRSGDGRAAAVQKVLDELPAVATRRTETAGKAQDQRLNLGREPHPFFGFTTTRNLPGVNNLGFYTSYKYPYIRKSGDFVVGIFGGSVAQQLASDVAAMNSLKARLLADLQTKRSDVQRVVVLNMALPGWRQPQQFNALHYFLRTIDLAVTLDGLNEVVGLQTNLDRNYPIDYPNPEVWLPLARSALKPDDVRTAAEIIGAQDSIRDWTDRLTTGVAGHSRLAHLCWQLMVNRRMVKIDALRKSLETSQWQDYDTTPTDEKGYATSITSYFDLYESSIRAAAAEAASQGKASVHFIQPNQYVPGTKPLSQDEQQLYVTNKYYSTTVSRYYPRLQEMAKRLNQNGLEVYDLSDTFAATGETLYRDDCCHVNAQGNLLLAAAIVKNLGIAGKAPVSH